MNIYPHFIRILLSGIRNLGRRPCPRCLVAMQDVEEMGTVNDLATRRSERRSFDDKTRAKVENVRRLIYDQNVQVTSSSVESHIAEDSLVPMMVKLL